MFRGVPFAAPPVRFRAPEPPQPWKGVRDATRFAPAAMQNGLSGADESEDCLYLNVWSPAERGPHPVLVWIHGGGFLGGRSSDPLQDGAIFARQGIVTVTITYRLGVFGFLDVAPLLGASYAGSADNGLRDVIRALSWVQSSIADFGGDPGRVTIAGQSAGAKIVGILLGTSAASGLFQQAISESGGAERVASAAASAEVAHGFEQSWARPAATLATAPAAELIEAQTRFDRSWPAHYPLRPSLDPSFLPQLPVDAVRSGASRAVRLLIGTNRDESAFFAGPAPAEVTGAALGNVSLASFERVAAKYSAAYPQTAPSRLRIRELTAEEYWVPSMRLLKAHVQAGGTAYAYRVDWSHTTGRLAGLAYHTIELPLVWATPAEKAAAAPEGQLASEVQAAWVAFICGKAPASEGLPAWPAYTRARQAAVILDTRSHVEEHFGEAELALWAGVV